MPLTAKGVHQRLDSAGVPFRRRQGRGGGAEYDAFKLPRETLSVLLAKRDRSARDSEARDEVVPAVEAAPPAPAPSASTLKGWQRDRMQARRALLAEVETRAATLGLIRACDDVAADARAGRLKSD